ncbi:MAG: methyltransferase [Geminicoccaceae bacterium]|nr:methyltransferase [Geminicoccaceae bacterium]
MPPPPIAHPGATLDGLLGGRVRLLQPERGYRVAIDPVLLAAAVAAKAGETVLDAGAGTGAVALCLTARVPGLAVAALERDPLHLGLLRANVALNDREDAIAVEPGDLLAPAPGLKARTFEWVATNPPFHPVGRSSPSPFASRAAAHGAAVPLADWIAACLRRAAPGGRLVLVHRAAELGTVMAALLDKAAEVTIFPVQARARDPAGRVVVRARKGGKGGVRLLPPLVLHASDGGWTAAAEAVLRGGASLDAVVGKGEA